MSAMTPERLEAVREHLETTGYSHAFKPQAFELLEEVDRLTAENARLRKAISRLFANFERWHANLPHDSLIRSDLAALLNPTEGDDPVSTDDIDEPCCLGWRKGWHEHGCPEDRP